MLTDLNPVRTEVGRATSPWNTQFDLRLNKRFEIAHVPVAAYVYVQNLFTRKNVTNIYWRTVSADDDGFIAPHPQEFIDINPDLFLLYKEINLNRRQHYALVNSGDLFARPREIRFGMQISLARQAGNPG